MAKNVGSYMRWLSLSNRLQAFGSRLKMFLFYGVFTLVAVPAPAWNDTGHKIVASIAYNELTPSGRIEVDTILKAHTNYNAWRAEHVSAHPNIDLGQFVFMQASTWPDEIRDNNDKKTHPH